MPRPSSLQYLLRQRDYHPGLNTYNARVFSTRQVKGIFDYFSALRDTMGAGTPSPSPGPAHAKPPNTSAGGTKRKRNAVGKYYAVKKGYQPGVYYEWKDCLAQVTGYKGAICEQTWATVPYPHTGATRCLLITVAYSPSISHSRGSKCILNRSKTTIVQRP